MLLALCAALASAFFLAIMVLSDRLLMSGCYENKPDTAWFVSSAAGSIFGITATLITWLFYSAFTTTTFISFFSALEAFFFPYGLLMVLAGAVNIQVMRPYFKLFTPEHTDDQVDETFIALSLASVPIFIFLATVVIRSLLPDFFFSTGLEAATITPLFGLGIFCTAAAMVGFELSGSHTRLSFTKYGEVAKMLSYIVIYSLLVSAILRSEEIGIFEMLVLQLFYWIGFAAAVRILLQKKSRTMLKESYRRVIPFIVPILFLEVAGMLVYYFEFFSLSQADPSLVNVIIGSHVLLVFVGAAMLYKLKVHLNKKGQVLCTVARISFSTSTLPEEQFSKHKFFWFIFVITALIATILLV